MSNVVDKAKMVFHYVAKMRATNSTEESSGGREMKVCFRHSKHSIKCDTNAPCLECDAGLKLYSYEQCRRHLDVVRSEKRFESIEVDRSENMIEKLSDIDENGKKMAQLLEMIATKQDSVVKSLSELQSVQDRPEVTTTHPKHELEEERISRETMNCSLKEISKNTLKAQKKAEEMLDQLMLCHTVLVELKASGVAISDNQVSGQSRLSEVNSNLAVISAKIDENNTNLRDATDAYSEASRQLRTTNDQLLEEIRQMKAFVATFESTLKQELSSMRTDFVTELQASRTQLIASHDQLRTELSAAIALVKDEVQGLKSLSQTMATDLRDCLPEKLMDVFGGILMLTADNNRKMDDDCLSGNNPSSASQFHKHEI